MVGAGSAKEAWGAESGIRKPKIRVPRKMDDVDYEKYLVRKPAYEQGPPVKGRQYPSMTVMSRDLAAGANHYIDLGWIWDMPDPNPHIFEMTHRYDEIVLHIGGDMHNPQSLGGEIEFVLGGQPLIVNRTSGIWVPKGVKHGPLTWKKFEKPHIQMAFMINCGDLKEGWGDSGIYEARTP